MLGQFGYSDMLNGKPQFDAWGRSYSPMPQQDRRTSSDLYRDLVHERAVSILNEVDGDYDKALRHADLLMQHFAHVPLICDVCSLVRRRAATITLPQGR